MIAGRKLAGFELRRVAWAVGDFTAYDAVREATGERVLLKRWEAREPPESVKEDPIWREWFALSQMEASPHAYTLGHHADGSGSWGVTPWYGGTPLSEHAFDHRPPLAALHVIETAARLLDYLHAAGGVHASLEPDSILWCEEPETVRFVDLGFALFPALPALGRARLLDRNKALYLSPEGTGRVGAELDHRGDFYSLGAVLYQLLVGQPPFDHHDSLQLAHAHLARQPMSPSQIDETVPPIVSQIVLRLLEKTPDARYRSGAGLAADLARCRRELAAGQCEPFDLGKEDVPTRLRLSTKLYARSAAQEQVRGLYERTKDEGRGLVMVSGPAGVGKTSLAESIRRTVVEDEGYFATAKFHHSRSAQPYLGIVEAAVSLANQLLTLPEERLAFWRLRLAESLGRNAGLLCKLVPEMNLVIGGNVAPSLEVSLEDVKAEFLVTVKRFVRVFTVKGSPFVLFLDDVQWMDDASGELLADLIADPDLEHFLVITAYRSDEVAADSALAAMLEAPPRVPTLQLSLEPLNVPAIAAFLKDSFGCTDSNALEFATVLKTKTDGNPFFLRRYVTSLAEDGLIYYSVNRHCWHCDLDEIGQRHVSDNLVHFMLQLLKAYTRETRDLLNYMSCLGEAVESGDLCVACGLSIDECSRLLTRPVNDGLVMRVMAPVTFRRDAYRFTHDKIEQAAYALLEPARRQQRHAQIARRMHEAGEDPHRSPFALVEQLDKAGDEGAALFQAEDLASIYFRAAERAKDGAAYAAARHYLQRAAAFVRESDWQQRYDLTSALFRARAEVEYQLGDLAASRSFVNVALRHCTGRHEQADLNKLLIVQNTLQGHYQEALDRGGYALSLLGFELPRSDIPRVLDEEVERLASIDLESRYDHVLSLPEIQDPSVSKVLEILMYLIPPSYFVHPDLNDLIAALMTRLSIEHGISPAGAKGVSNFGPAIAKRGRFREGYLFAKLALELAEKHGYRKVRPRILYTLAGDLNHWVNHLRTTHDIVDEGFAQCMEQGERDYAGYLLTVARCQNEIFLGQPIGQFKRQVAEIREHVDATQNALGRGLVVAAYLALSHLDGSTDDDAPFDVGDLSEAALLQSITAHDHGLVGCYFHLLKAHNYVFLGRYDQATKNIAVAQSYRSSLSAEISLAFLNFFSSLTAIESIAEGDFGEDERAARLAEVRDNQERMRTWSDGCPENFLHCYLIVRARLEALEGRTLDAVGSYEEAIRAAGDHGFVQFEGLAQSLLADLWRRCGHPEYADVHLAYARTCYERWGATRLVAHLDRLSRPAKAVTHLAHHADQAGTEESVNEGLDLKALFELTQRLSSEIDLDHLKAAFANAVVQVTGAQKVVVFLAEAGGYQPVAALDIEGQPSRPEQATYPAAMVNLVGRTREASLIQEGLPDPHVAHDPYLRASCPTSAVCLPLVQQTALEGMVYLENRINRMDLSERKLRYLSVLCSQAAISIRNSLLYAELERKVAERTSELAALANDLESRVEQQVEQIKNLEKLRRFLSPHVADLVLSSGEEDLLKSHRRRVAILYCDLRGFTAFSESVEPEEAMEMLKSYHRTVGKIIRRHRATVDHLAGDGIMVFLGDPIICEQPITDAIEMAVEMRTAIQALVAEWEPLGPELGFGIGATYGYATIGLVGDDQRMEYSATGRYVNLASRLCDEATASQILVTKRIANALDGRRRTAYVNQIQFKGFNTPIEVYNVIE